MSGQQPEKTRERAPANLGIKFNPALGAANIKRFYATVRALLKSNEQSGELALAVLEGRANSSKQSLVLFEPREIDYDKVVAVLKETNDEAKALAAGKAEAVFPLTHIGPSSKWPIWAQNPLRSAIERAHSARPVPLF